MYLLRNLKIPTARRPLLLFKNDYYKNWYWHRIFLCIGSFVLFYTLEHLNNTEATPQEKTGSTQIPIVPEKTETERRDESPPTVVSENSPTDSEKSEAIQEKTATTQENSEPDCLLELNKFAIPYSKECAIHATSNTHTKVIVEIHIQPGLTSTIQFQRNDNKKLIPCLERQWRKSPTHTGSRLARSIFIFTIFALNYQTPSEVFLN